MSRSIDKKYKSRMECLFQESFKKMNKVFIFFIIAVIWVKNKALKRENAGNETTNKRMIKLIVKRR